MVRTVVLEGRLRRLARVGHDLVHNREGQVVLGELAGVLTANIRIGNLSDLDDLQAGRAHTVAGSHFLVERVNRGVHRGLAVLLVGVVETRARLVADPDAKVLNSGGILLEDLRNVKKTRVQRRQSRVLERLFQSRARARRASSALGLCALHRDRSNDAPRCTR